VGDSFFAIPLSEAQRMLSTSTEETEQEITKVEEELENVRGEMEGLKAHLYARFGRGINLES
jgi:prefoldin subunit 4